MCPIRIIKSANRNVVLIYHSIGDSEWSVSETKFSAQMHWLAYNANLVSLSKLLEKPKNVGLNVAITFDDGYESIYKIALPIMDRYKFTATVYLNTGWIKESHNEITDELLGHYPGETFMNWSQVSELKNNGWNIGSHGVEHEDLTMLPEQKIKYELEQSKLKIEKKLNSYCNDFSYTWGNYNSEISALVKKSGYKTAVSGEHGPLKENTDKFSLPRIDIRREYNTIDFEAVVSGSWDYLRYIQKYRNA